MSDKNVKGNKRDGLEVTVHPQEEAEQAIRRFMKKFKTSGLMVELLERRAYEKPSQKRKRKRIRSQISQEKD